MNSSDNSDNSDANNDLADCILDTDIKWFPKNEFEYNYDLCNELYSNNFDCEQNNSTLDESKIINIDFNANSQNLNSSSTNTSNSSYDYNEFNDHNKIIDLHFTNENSNKQNHDSVNSSHDKICHDQINPNLNANSDFQITVGLLLHDCTCAKEYKKKIEKELFGDISLSRKDLLIFHDHIESFCKEKKIPTQLRKIQNKEKNDPDLLQQRLYKMKKEIDYCIQNAMNVIYAIQIDINENIINSTTKKQKKAIQNLIDLKNHLIQNHDENQLPLIQKIDSILNSYLLLQKAA